MGRRMAGNMFMVRLPLFALHATHCCCFIDKLFKLPVDIRKSTLLFKLRMPPDLMESANPGCPEQFRAGDIISLGVCRWTSPSIFLFLQAHHLCQYVTF